jgi:hypothetical protein
MCMYIRALACTTCVHTIVQTMQDMFPSYTVHKTSLEGPYMSLTCTYMSQVMCLYVSYMSYMSLTCAYMSQVMCLYVSYMCLYVSYMCLYISYMCLYVSYSAYMSQVMCLYVSQVMFVCIMLFLHVHVSPFFMCSCVHTHINVFISVSMHTTINAQMQTSTKWND